MFYYSTDGTVFKSKIKAIEHRALSGNEISYYYFDHIYSKLNWKIEPVDSLEYHYAAQAQRLRDKYDYLILCYSGGYDSTNILETFFYNNIKLDKIVIVGAFSQDSTSGVDENHNGELYKNAFPYIDELGLSSITEKFDYTELFADVKNLSIVEQGSDWVDTLGGWFSPHNWFWRDIEKFVIPKNIGSKKVGLIFGRDKPSLIGNKFRFSDTPINSYGNSTGTLNCTRINFYWDPEYPQILLKQLHILHRVHTNIGTTYNHSSTAVVTSNGLNTNRIIYDLKKPLIFKSPKSKTNLISLRDNYLSRKRNSSTFALFTDGIKNIQTRVGIENIKPISGRYYEI